MDSIKHLLGVLFRATENDAESVQYLQCSLNHDISEYFTAFKILFLGYIDQDENARLRKDQIQFLAFCYINRLIEVNHAHCTGLDKRDMLCYFMNALFSLPLEFQHHLDMSYANIAFTELKDVAQDISKWEMYTYFFGKEVRFFLSDFYNSTNPYLLSTFSFPSQNKFAQILSALCIYGKLVFFDYVFFFLIYFVNNNCERKMEKWRRIFCSGTFTSDFTAGCVVPPPTLFFPYSFALPGNKLKTVNDETIKLYSEDAYFHSVVHICVNFIKETMALISNVSNLKLQKVLKEMRVCILEHVDVLFSLLYNLYKCIFLSNIKKQMEMFIEFIKEISFFLPVHLFISRNETPVIFIVNLLTVYLSKGSGHKGIEGGNTSINTTTNTNTNTNTNTDLNIDTNINLNTNTNSFGNPNVNSNNNNNNNKDDMEARENEYDNLYQNYISFNDLRTMNLNWIYEFLDNEFVLEFIFSILFNLAENITKLNNKSFLSMKEESLLLFLENLFKINLNFYNPSNYVFQKLYTNIILTLSTVPIATYLYKKENQLRILSGFVSCIFSNIYHPDENMFLNLVTICKNVFEKNRNWFYIKFKVTLNTRGGTNNSNSSSNIGMDSCDSLFNENFNIADISKAQLLDLENSKALENRFILNYIDLRKIFILLFIRYLKIYKLKECNEISRTYLMQFISGWVDEFTSEWFRLYFVFLENAESDFYADGNIYNNYNAEADKYKVRIDVTKRITNLLEVLCSLNHSVFHLMVNVFYEFTTPFINNSIFTSTNSINSSTNSLANSVSNSLANNSSGECCDSFLMIVTSMYFQLFQMFVELIIQFKNKISKDDKELLKVLIYYQSIINTDIGMDSANHIYTNLDNFIMDIYKHGLISAQVFADVTTTTTTTEYTSSSGTNMNIMGKVCVYEEREKEQEKEKEKEKEKIREKLKQQMDVVNCFIKYKCSPYFEMCKNCSAKLLFCFKCFTEKDGTPFFKNQGDFVNFETKKLHLIINTAYILNYDKNYAYNIMSSLFGKVLQNGNLLTTVELKVYLNMCTSLITNLSTFLSAKELEELLNRFKEIKQSSDILRYNKELTFFLLTTLSLLKIDHFSNNVEDKENIRNLLWILKETKEVLQACVQNKETFFQVINLLYTTKDGDTSQGNASMINMTNMTNVSGLSTSGRSGNINDYINNVSYNNNNNNYCINSETIQGVVSSSSGGEKEKYFFTLIDALQVIEKFYLLFPCFPLAEDIEKRNKYCNSDRSSNVINNTRNMSASNYMYSGVLSDMTGSSTNVDVMLISDEKKKELENTFLFQQSQELSQCLFIMHAAFKDMVSNYGYIQKVTQLCLESDYFRLHPEEQRIYQELRKQHMEKMSGTGNYGNSINTNTTVITMHNNNNNNNNNNKKQILNKGSNVGTSRVQYPCKMIHCRLRETLKAYIKSGYPLFSNSAPSFFKNLLLWNAPSGGNETIVYFPFVRYNDITVISSFVELWNDLYVMKKLNIHVTDWYKDILNCFFSCYFEYIEKEERYIKQLNKLLNEKKILEEEEDLLYYDYIQNYEKSIFVFLNTIKKLFHVPKDCDEVQLFCFMTLFYDVSIFEKVFSSVVYLLNYHNYGYAVIIKCLDFFKQLSMFYKRLYFDENILMCCLNILEQILIIFISFNPSTMVLHNNCRNSNKVANFSSNFGFSRDNQRGIGGGLGMIGDSCFSKNEEMGGEEYQESGYNEYNMSGLNREDIYASGMFEEDKDLTFVGEMQAFAKKDPNEKHSYFNYFLDAFIFVGHNILTHNKIPRIYPQSNQQSGGNSYQQNSIGADVVNFPTEKLHQLFCEKLKHLKLQDIESYDKIIQDLLNGGERHFVRQIFIEILERST